MRKRHFLLLAFAITGLALNGCSGGGTTDVDTSQTESVAESESSEVEPDIDGRNAGRIHKNNARTG